jgi:hypothetical protein
MGLEHEWSKLENNWKKYVKKLAHHLILPGS